MMKKMKQILILVMASMALVSTGWSAVVIDHVRIENLEKTILDESFVRAYTSLRAGQEIESEVDLHTAVAQDVDNLRKSGRFTFVRAFLEKDGETLTLVYSVTPKLRLRKIEISGAENIGNRKIKKELKLELGEYIDEAMIGEKARLVEAYCRKNKYPDAAVSWELANDPETGAADLFLTVEEGNKLRVKRIEFTGDRFLSDKRTARTGRFFKRITPGKTFELEEGWFETSTLKKEITQKKTWWITSWFGAYNPDLADADLVILHRFYRNEGFLDVEVATPEVEDLGDGKMGLIYHITEGEQYRIRSLRIEGATLFEVDALEKQIHLTLQEIASQSAIDQAAASLNRYYGNRGYIHNVVTPTIETDPATHQADVLFSVREGALAHINEISIVGNEKTKDQVIRRELAVYPGELFNQQKVETSENRLRNLGYFDVVNSSYTPAEETNTYDMAFTVNEKTMGSFLIGAGFSSVDSIVGFAELSHGNFDIMNWPPVGDGQKMKIRVQAGSERSDLEISFVEPWFMDRKLALGVDLYSRNASYYSDDYDLSTLGGRVSLSKPLSPFIRGKLSYSLEQFDVYNIASDAPSEIVDEKGKRIKSTVGLTISRDTRDHYFIAKHGNYSAATSEFSGGPLAGETDIYFLELKSSQFWTLWKEHVLNVKGSVRVVDGYGSGDDVPIFDRLFLGGPRTLRGFEYRDVSPRSVSDPEEPIGGQSSYYGTVEYIVPLWSKIRGAVFYDIGAVNVNSFDFGTGGLNSDYGFGVRFDLPSFPLQLDYAFPHITDENNEDASPRWNFLLGYSF